MPAKLLIQESSIMTYKHLAALIGVAVLFAGATQAQEAPGFTWEGSLELEYSRTFKSDTPGNEFGAATGTLDLSGAYRFNDTISVFAALTGESVNDPVPGDRYFTDWGLYIKELGVQFDTGAASFQLGKVSPVFGIGWDQTAGFFAADLAEDYELTEQLGALVAVDLGSAGMLHAGLFYADDTALSRSAGFRRGRNTSAAGGAGNTGRLDNGAVTWIKSFGETELRLGVRHLSRGAGDVKSENGVVASLFHSFHNMPLDLFAEVASFSGYGGTADDASYATLNAAYALGDVTLSGTYARRDIDSTGLTELFSVGAEYEFGERYLVGAALARIEEAGAVDHVFGVNFEIALGV